MSRAKTKLGVVEKPLPNASILNLNEAPLDLGREQEDLLCGGCEIILIKGMSALTAKARFAAPNQLIAVCPGCGAYNAVPFAMRLDPNKPA